MTSQLQSCIGGEPSIHGYRAYGLSVASELLLPELAPLAGKVELDQADIRIRRDHLSPQSVATKEGRDYARPIADGIELYVENIGTIQVRGGREIVVDPAFGSDDQVLRPLLLGTAFALLLLNRGQVVLHASVVSIDGSAVAFVGNKGAGKSTLAAALQSRGHALVADDMLAFDLTQDALVVQTGFVHMKLWPDTVLAFGQNPADYPSLHPQVPKRMVRLTSGYAKASVPLHSLCMLQVGPDIRLEQRLPRLAVFDLLPHWSGARVSKAVLGHLGLATHFQHCLAVASRVPVYHLQRPLDFSRLDEVTQMVTRLVTG